MLRAAIQRAMGIRRKVGVATVLKWLLALIPFILVVVAIVILATSPQGGVLSYVSFYQTVALVCVIFAALVAPDLLCPDRRERVLSLYFAAPVTSLSYMGAQFLGLALLLLVLTLLPPLALFVGHMLFADSAATYVSDHAADLGHILLAGGLLGLYYSALATAVSSFNDRRAYAAGGFLGLLLVSSAAAGIIAQGLHFSGHERFAVLDLIQLPIRAARWIFGEAPEPRVTGYVPSVSGGVYTGACVALIAASLVLVTWRYRRAGDP